MTFGIDVSGWRPPVITTDRLLLRPIDEADAPEIFAYASNPRVSEQTLWEAHRSLDDTLHFIREYAFAHYDDGALDPYLLEQRSDGAIIGTAGVFWVSKATHHAELGYALGERWWGQGFAFEASRAIVSLAFRDFGVERIQARTRVTNVRSRRVIEKLGMQLEGVLRSAGYSNGEFWDIQLFSVLRGEWTFG